MLMVLPYIAVAQSTTVSGKVTDATTGEPLPFVNVAFINSTVGTMTNVNGDYTLHTLKPTDSLMVYSIGYKETTIYVSPGAEKIIDFELEPKQFELEAVVIRPGKNPAHAIIRKAIKNRNVNDPNKHDSVTCDVYSKVNASLINLDSSIMDVGIIKRNPDLLVKENDSTFSLPVYFMEKIYTEYIHRSLGGRKTVIKGAREEGARVLTDNIIGEYAETLTEDVSLYNNYVFFMKNHFITPLSNLGFMYYKYSLIDTVIEDNKAYYVIKYWPKRDKDLAFNGRVYIHDVTYGIKDITARLSAGANLNYVQDMQINESYELTGNLWVPKHKSLLVDYKLMPVNDTSLMEGTRKMRINKTNSFKNYKASFSQHEYEQTVRNNLTRSFENEKLDIKDTVYWNDRRHIDLDEIDQQTLGSINQINQVRSIRWMDRMMNMFFYGYYDLGKVEVGPWMFFYMSNAIEGNRFNLAAKTSPELLKTVMLSGYIGYGTKDQKLKFGAGIHYKMPSYKRQIIGASYGEDVIRFGDYQQNLKYVRENMLVQSSSNILSAILQTDPIEEVYNVKKAGFDYEIEWRKGLINKVYSTYYRHYSPVFYPFTSGMGNPVKGFDNYEVTINTRLTFNEETSDNYFRRIYLDTKRPIIHLDVTYGNYTFNNFSGDYYKLRTVITQNTNIGLGEMNYVVEAGKYFGKMPYTLLEIPRANESVGLASYMFNHLAYLEYAADQFVSTMICYNLNGLILNSIPLIRRLNFREILTFKGFYGNINYAHNEIIEYPFELVQKMKEPHMEVGAGLTNIFKVLRLEYVWRLNALNNFDIGSSGLHFRFSFDL